MANRPKSSGPPGGKKSVHLRPTVKTDAETIRPEHAVDLGESRPEPPVAVVVKNGAVAAVAVTGQVRGISEHEVNAPGTELRQDRQAIAVDDLIDEVRGRRWTGQPAVLWST